MQQRHAADTGDARANGAESKETGRIEAFSDGIFAIAITLLVLDIKVPRDIPDGGLAHALAGLWPSYLAFLTSFLTIGVMWINHHRLFTLVHRTDQLLLVFNALLLLGVTFLPFPTALIAEYLGRPDSYVAAAVYNGTFILIALFFTLLWRHISRGNRLLARDADPAWVAGITRQYAFGPVIYAVTLLVGLWSVPASLCLNIAVALFFALPAHRMGKA
jgi:uncharacterized membrane protein